MMAFRSRQAKKVSRACQHWLRAWRLGASKAPSEEGVGVVGVGVGAVGAEKRFIVGGGGVGCGVVVVEWEWSGGLGWVGILGR